MEIRKTVEKITEEKAEEYMPGGYTDEWEVIEVVEMEAVKKKDLKEEEMKEIAARPATVEEK